jgi:ABC-type amino acid transport substrate-binding protein
LQDGVGRAAYCRRAAQTKTVLERRRGVPRAAAGRDRLRLLPEAEPRRRINYSGSTDQLLEAIATGKSDTGLGMALRWLKPLEQGFDVKISAGTRGGCMRVLTRNGSGVDKLADLKGKIVAVGDLAGPDKNFFSIQLAKLGIDPNRDVDWRAYPGNLLNLAVEKGEVQAFLSSDPLAYLWLKDSQYKGSRLQPGWRIPRQELLHRRPSR